MFNRILSNTVYRDGLKVSYTKSGLDYIEERGGLGDRVEPTTNLGDYVLFSSKDIEGELATVHFFKEVVRVITFLDGKKEVYFLQYNK